jgi:hypothetical protein
MPMDSWSCILQKSQISLEALTIIAHRRPPDSWAEHEHARLDTWTTRLHGSDSQPTSTQIGFQLDAIAAEATLQILDALIINLVLCKFAPPSLSIARHDIVSSPRLQYQTQPPETGASRRRSLRRTPLCLWGNNTRTIDWFMRTEVLRFTNPVQQIPIQLRMSREAFTQTLTRSYS